MTCIVVFRRHRGHPYLLASPKVAGKMSPTVSPHDCGSQRMRVPLLSNVQRNLYRPSTGLWRLSMTVVDVVSCTVFFHQVQDVAGVCPIAGIVQPDPLALRALLLGLDLRADLPSQGEVLRGAPDVRERVLE